MSCVVCRVSCAVSLGALLARGACVREVLAELGWWGPAAPRRLPCPVRLHPARACSAKGEAIQNKAVFTLYLSFSCQSRCGVRFSGRNFPFYNYFIQVPCFSKIQRTSSRKSDNRYKAVCHMHINHHVPHAANVAISLLGRAMRRCGPAGCGHMACGSPPAKTFLAQHKPGAMRAR